MKTILIFIFILFQITHGNAETLFTKKTLVNLSLTATDNGSGMAWMVFSNDGGNWSFPEPYSKIKKNWDLAVYGGNNEPGTKTVYVRFCDIAGNWSDPITQKVILYPDMGCDADNNGIINIDDVYCLFRQIMGKEGCSYH
jgi:hypothetical protein